MFILCHRLRSRLAINIQSCLELYLYQNETRRRVLDTLCRLELTISYDTMLRRLTTLVANAERKIEALKRQLSTIVTYDNFDYVVDRREERIENKRIMRLITTTLIFERRKFDEKCLTLSMWQSRAHLLSTERLARKLKSNEINASIWWV